MNINEGHAFVTVTGYDEHISQQWPNAIFVGENYKLITFAKTKESDIKSLAESLGYECKYLPAQETINCLTNGNTGPFFVYGKDAHTVVNHFNPETEE